MTLHRSKERTQNKTIMKFIEETKQGRVYQSGDFNECWQFIMLHKGEFSVDYYDDFIKGFFTVII